MAEDDEGVHQPDAADGSPYVADWRNPTPDERDALLSLPLEQLTRLAELHPELIAFLRTGLKALEDARSGEHAAYSHLADSYFANSMQFVGHLVNRLSEEGISEHELDLIYNLIGKQQDQDDRKTTEFLRAHNRAGSKTVIAVGVVLGVGLALYVYKGRNLPSLPRPSFG